MRASPLTRTECSGYVYKWLFFQSSWWKHEEMFLSPSLWESDKAPGDNTLKSLGVCLEFLTHQWSRISPHQHLCQGGFFSWDSALGSLDFPSQPACFSTSGGSSLLCDLVLGGSKNRGWFSVFSASVLLWGWQWRLPISSSTRLGMKIPTPISFITKLILMYFTKKQNLSLKHFQIPETLYPS